MRLFIAVAVAGSLIATNLLAAETGALPAGKPAGVRNAQGADNTVWWLAGGLALTGVIVAAAAGGSSTAATVPPTTSQGTP